MNLVPISVRMPARDASRPPHASSCISFAHRYVAVACLALSACALPPKPPAAIAYTPRRRELTVTTVPLLVKEERNVFPFLQPAFAKGGVLEGKEVYTFSPSTLTVVEGDTVRFTFINPEDDAHSFVLPDFAVPLPGGKVTYATYVAKRSGIYPILCAVQTHLPMMSGQFVVLAPAAVASESVVPAVGRVAPNVGR